MTSHIFINNPNDCMCQLKAQPKLVVRLDAVKDLLSLKADIELCRLCSKTALDLLKREKKNIQNGSPSTLNL